MKLPKMYRKKRADGRHTGSWRAAVKGDDVNLGTSDANEARKRLLEAVRRGRRNFVDELDEAADGLESTDEGAAAAAAAVRGTAPQVDTAPAAAAAPPVVKPDAVIPPRAAPLQLPPVAAADARAEAEATNEAAAETADAADAGGAAPLPPDVLDSFLEQGGLVIVDLQLELQAALIRKRTGKQPKRIPDESPIRSMAAAAWSAQLKIWFPGDKMLPPWAMALILPAMCLPQQFATAEPIKEDKSEVPADSGDPTVQAAA